MADVLERARQSTGISFPSIFGMAVDVLRREGVRGATLVDVGCGRGALRRHVQPHCSRYIGLDILRWEDFPADAEFEQVDLETGRSGLPDATADVVVSLETIEHLENPRAVVRELARLARPGGLILVSTPNQLSLGSKLCLLLKNQHREFQAPSYPAHLTALLEIDLIRIATECGLAGAQIVYNAEGRVPLGPWRYPRFLCRMFPRALSDFVMLVATKP